MNDDSSLSSQQILETAIAIQENNKIRYEEWAERFRPYDRKICSLLEHLAQKENACRQKLVDLHAERFISFARPMDLATVNNDEVALPRICLEHFFVLNQKMALLLLLSVCQMAFNAYVSYQRALSETTDPVLQEIYAALALIQQSHVRLIKKNLEEFGPSYGQPLIMRL